ncbi:MAG: dienelactone hydrolase family protein [Thaumarchaeota archaeon]|nr:dienelactone hydrolase family protein [Nitrososphaerota archaeon]
MRKSASRATKSGFTVKTKRASACVVVLHEIWGLVPHTRDVCKLVGKLGFAAHAPNMYAGDDDLLIPNNIQKAMEGVWELSLEERRDKAKVAEALDRKQVGEEVRETAALLYDQGFRDRLLRTVISAAEEAGSRYDRVATLGFCVGGGLSLKTAASTDALTCAVSFYGEPPNTELLRKITVPMLAIYAQNDEIINSKVPAFVGESLNIGKDLTLKTYPSTKHGFFNDSRKAVYDRGAATESWEFTRWFLNRNLRRH